MRFAPPRSGARTRRGGGARERVVRPEPGVRGRRTTRGGGGTPSMARRGWGGGGRAGGFWDAVPSPRGSTVETPAAGFSERATEHQHFCSVLRRGRTPPLESRFLARIGTAFASPAPPGPAPAVHDARDLRARAGARARGAPARPRGAPAPPLGRSPAPPPRPRPPRPDRPRAPGPPPRPRRADASARGERRPRPDFDVGGRAGRGGRGPVPRRRGESAGRPRDLVSGRRVGRRRRVVGRRAAGGGGCRASISRRTGTSPPPPARRARGASPFRGGGGGAAEPSEPSPFHPDSVVSALPGAVGSATRFLLAARLQASPTPRRRRSPRS